MEHHKISKLLNDSTALRFATRGWIEVIRLLWKHSSMNQVQ